MNQNAEQRSRDAIDRQLQACGWILQDKKTFNLTAGTGVVLREWQTAVGPAAYVLFVNGKPVGIIEDKSEEEEGVRLTTVEGQSTEHAAARLKYIKADDPLLFVYGRDNRICKTNSTKIND